MIQIQLNLSPQVIRELAAAFILKRLTEEKKRGVMKNFIMPDLVGSIWPPALEPFYEMYGRTKTAGHQLGKVLKQEAIAFGCNWKKEDRRGRKESITRYFFDAPDKEEE